MQDSRRIAVVLGAGVALLTFVYAIAGPFVFGCDARYLPPFIVVVVLAFVSAGVATVWAFGTEGAGPVLAVAVALTVAAADTITLFFTGLSQCGG